MALFLFLFELGKWGWCFGGEHLLPIKFRGLSKFSNLACYIENEAITFLDQLFFLFLKVSN
jgi:hypothetical protein